MARIHLKLSQKGEIVEQLDKGVGVTVLAKNYGVAKSTICSIRNRRVNIMKKISNTYVGPGKIKTLRSSECPRMENALYRWFLKQREKHIPVTGFMIKEKAKKLHEEYKETPCFNASSGWLQRYKKRFGIRYLKISGEKLSSAIETVNPFKKTLLEKLDELQLLKEQIYNADESSLYWKLLPDKTYVGSEEKTAPGRKTEKQRVTFLACTNAAGNHKLKPLVIGKAKNPRSFRNFNCPVHYRNSKTAWMTRFIFKEWFFKMFIPEVQEFLNDKKLPVKAILLLDNALSHPPADELKSADGSIFVMYMPPNITPLIQPMDQNVIRLTKLFYRKSLLSRIINDNVDCIGTALKSLSLKDAIVNLILAWNFLKPDVIEKCWNKILSPLEETPSDSDDEYDIPLSELKLRWRNKEMEHVTKEIKNLLLHVNPRVEIETADIDEWNRDYVQDVEEAEIFIESDEVSDDVPDENSENNIQAITTSNALKSLNEVIQWTDENQNRIDYSTIIVLHNLRHAMVQMNVEKTQKQTKITSFFEKIF